MDHFQLRLVNRNATTSVVALVRKHTNEPLDQIRPALSEGKPVLDVRTRHNTFDEFITRTTTFMDSLESNGEAYQCIVDGVDEPSEYVRNVFAQWTQIVNDLADEDDRRFGDASAE